MKKNIFFALFAFTSLSFAGTLDPNEALKFDTNVTRGALENGVKYYIQENPVPKNSAFFYLDIDTGSVDENDDEQGYAHFVEHMAFNGSENFDKNELVKKLESLGVKFGADLNAQTSFEHTTYNIQANVNDESLKDIFLVLKDYASGLKFEKAEVQKEKGVILEEAKKDYRTRFYEKRAQYIYPKSRFAARFPIGKNNDIADATSEKLMAFWQRNYNPENLSVIVVGDVNATQIQNLITQNFSAIRSRAKKIPRDLSLKPFKAGFENLVEQEIGTNIASVIFAGAHEPVATIGALKLAWLERYVNKLLSLSYDAMNVDAKVPLKGYFDGENLFSQRRLYTFSANIFDFDANASLESLFSAIKGVRAHGFSKSDFESAKAEFLNSIKEDLLKNDTQSEQVYDILDFVHNANIKLSKNDDYKLSLAIIDEISLEDVNEFFAQITASDHFVELISTKNLGLSASDIDKIYANAKPFNFSKNGLNGKKLIENEPLPAKFNKNFDADKNITTLKFENGAKVILKQNHSKTNVIAIAAKRLGGVSNFPSKPDAEIFASLMNSGTIGEFNEYDAKLLTSRFDYSLGFSVGETLSGFSGTSAAKDVGAMLKELYVRMSNPKIHENSLAKYQNAVSSKLALRDETSKFRFAKQSIDALYGADKRYKMPIEITDVKGANLVKFQGFANEIFKNAGEFLFVISGDFRGGELDDALARYVGGLKGSASKSEISPTRLSVNYAKLEENYGNSDKSEAQMIYLNYDLSEFDFQNSYKFAALQNVLSTQIVEKIREARGLIYSAGVHVTYAQFPQIKAELSISFSCKEADREIVIAGIDEILGDIRKNGASEQDLQNFKKAQILSMARASEGNEFWLNNIFASEFFGYPFYEPTAYSARINALSSDDVKSAANLLPAKPFVAILNPKK